MDKLFGSLSLMRHPRTNAAASQSASSARPAQGVASDQRSSPSKRARFTQALKSVVRPREGGGTVAESATEPGGQQSTSQPSSRQGHGIRRRLKGLVQSMGGSVTASDKLRKKRSTAHVPRARQESSHELDELPQVQRETTSSSLRTNSSQPISSLPHPRAQASGAAGGASISALEVRDRASVEAASPVTDSDASRLVEEIIASVQREEASTPEPPAWDEIISKIKISLDTERSDSPVDSKGYTPKVSGPREAPHLQTLLMRALSDIGGRFLMCASLDEQRLHALVKPDGALVVIKLHSQGVTALHQDQPNASLAEAARSQASLKLSSTMIEGGGVSVALPDSFIQEQVTGRIQPGSEGAEFTLYDSQLYRWDTSQWRKAPVSFLSVHQDKQYSGLARHQGGQVTVIEDDNRLVSLGTGRLQLGGTFPHKIVDVTLGKNGEETVLLADKNDRQQLWLSAPGNPTQKLTTERRLAALYRQGNWLVGADASGRLLIDEVPQQSSSRALFSSPVEEGASQLKAFAEQHIRAVIGHSHCRIEAFSPADESGFYAIVADSREQRRAVHLDLVAKENSSSHSWNLTNALALENIKGLPSLTDVDPMQQIRLRDTQLREQEGLALHEGRIYYQTAAGRHWQATDLKAKQLGVNREGRPWCLVDDEYSSIKIEKDRIRYGGNSLSLSYARRIIKKDKELPGLSSEQASNIKTLVPLDDNRYLTLESGGGINLYDADPKITMDKRQVVVLSRSALAQQMRHVGVNQDSELLGVNIDTSSLALDSRLAFSDSVESTVLSVAVGPENRLFLTDTSNRLFSCPYLEWSHGNLDGMRMEQLPDNDILHEFNGQAGMLHASDPETLLFKRGDKVFAYQQGAWAEWSESSSSAAQERGASRMDAVGGYMTKSHQLRKNGVGVKGTLNTFGVRAAKQTSVKDRAIAHVVQPVRAFPSALRRIPQAWNGRAGVQPLYDALFEQMDAFAHRSVDVIGSSGGGAGRAVPGLMPRLEASLSTLNNPEWGKQVGEFIKLLNSQTAHHARLLNDIHGGGNTTLGRKYGHAVDHLRFRNRHDGGDLLNKLTTLLKSYPAGLENEKRTPSAILEEIAKRGQSLRYPSRVGRDRYGSDNLLKGALIQDAETFEQLNQVVTRLERAAAQRSSSAPALEDIEQEYRRCKERWDNSLVIQSVKTGAVNLRQFEAIYDAVKAMITAVSNPSHGLNMNLRSALGVKKHDVQTLKTEVKQLLLGELPPGSAVNLTRGYGATATLLFSPDLLVGAPLTVGVGMRMGLDRNHTLTITRADEHSWDLKFERKGTGKVTSMAYAGAYESLPFQNLTGLSIWGGAGLMGTGSVGRANTLGFTLNREDTESFIDRLIEGRVTESSDQSTSGANTPRRGHGPLDLLALVAGDKKNYVSWGKSRGLELNMYAGASALIHAPLAEIDTDTGTVSTPTWRIGGRGYLSTSAFAYQKKSTTKVTEDASTQTTSDNRPAVFEEMSAMLEVLAVPGMRVDYPVGTTQAYLGPGVASVTASFDKSQERLFKYEAKGVGPVEEKDVEEAITKLKAAFDDHQEALQWLEKLTTSASSNSSSEGNNNADRTPSQGEEDQLRQLAEYFSKGEFEAAGSRNKVADEFKQEALKNLDRLVAQDEARNGGKPMLAKVEYSIEDKDPRKIPTQQTGKDFQSALIGGLVAGDDRLRRMVQQLKQKAPDVTAKTELELNADGHAVANRLGQYYGLEAAEAYIFYALTNNRTFLDNFAKGLREGFGVQGGVDFIATIFGEGECWMRVKSLSFTSDFDKTTEMKTPRLLIGLNNSSGLGLALDVGKIAFHYREEDGTSDDPNGYTLDGSAMSDLVAQLDVVQENLRNVGIAARYDR